MQSISVFLDKTKSADFRFKNANVSRNERVFHVIFFGSSSGKATLSSFIIVGCDFREGDLFAPRPLPSSVSSPEKVYFK